MVPVDRTSAHLVGDEESSKRRQVLDGACKVFLDLGFDGASMGEIARAAGVSKGTLYVYFADKCRLFEAIVEDEVHERRQLAFYSIPHATSRRHYGGSARPISAYSAGRVADQQPAWSSRSPSVCRKLAAAILPQRSRTNTMPETVTVDGPPVANEAATVSASAGALHLDCSRAYLGKLEADGVIQRQGDGFPLDQSRVAYLRYLRRERQQSPRSEADADHVKVKTEMLQLRLMEKKRELVRRADVDELIDSLRGLFSRI
jgi:AcrR family transcriptional regulator